MKCAQPPQRPLQWLHRHVYTQTHSATTPHSMCPDNTHTYPLATSQQPTNQPTNQPTSQTQLCQNQSTNNQPTNGTTNQAARKPTANQPTSQVPVHMGGDSITWEEGGQSILLTRTAQCITQLGGGGAREEGWWEGGTCTLGNPTPQTHMAGRREGETHLPLGVTVYPLLHPNQKNQHTCKEEMDTLPNLKHNKQGPHNLDHNMERGRGLIARH